MRDGKADRPELMLCERVEVRYKKTEKRKHIVIQNSEIEAE